MIELLESRIAPAGLIVVTLSNGNVLLKDGPDDAGDESAILTQPADGKLVITPAANVSVRFLDTTTEPGIPLTLDGFTGDLVASFGGGNDSLTLNGGTYSGDVRINLGDARKNPLPAEVSGNYFVANGVTFGGAFIYNGGAQPDSVEFYGSTTVVEKKFSVSLGSGANQFIANVADFQLKSGMQISSGTGNDLIVFKGAKLAVTGGLSVRSGAGSDTIQFTSGISDLSVSEDLSIVSSGSRSVTVEQSITGVAKISVLGSLKMTAGTGDRVQQTLTGTTDSLEIEGSVRFSATNPTEHTQSITASGTGFTVAGAIALNSRGLTSSQTLSVHTSDVKIIGGSVSLRGATSAVLSVNATLSEPASIITSSGRSASISVIDTTFGGDLRIVTKDTFSRTASITLNGINAMGAIDITGGSGATTLKVDQTQVSHTFKASLGDGANRFLIEQESQDGVSAFTEDVELIGGRDVDIFLIGGTGNNALHFVAEVIANGRGGIDTLTEGEASTHADGRVLVKRSIP